MTQFFDAPPRIYWRVKVNGKWNWVRAPNVTRHPNGWLVEPIRVYEVLKPEKGDE